MQLKKSQDPGGEKSVSLCQVRQKLLQCLGVDLRSFPKTSNLNCYNR